MKFDSSKLPPKTQFILDKYLVNKNMRVPKEVLLLNFLTTASNVLCANRVKVRDDANSINTFPNLFTLIFMSSGTGKDKSKKDVFKMFDLVSERMEEDYAKWKDKYMEELYLKSKTTCTTKSAQEKWVAAREPQEFKLFFNDGTPEGLNSLRLSLEAYGQGSAFFLNSEFADYIESEVGAKKDFLDTMKAYSEGGETDGVKLTKGDRGRQAKSDIPAVMLVHSSPANMNDEKKNINRIDKFFNRGMGRRVIMSYIKNEDIKSIERSSPDDIRKGNSDALSILPTIKDSLLSMYNNTARVNTPRVALSYDYTVVKMSDYVSRDYTRRFIENNEKSLDLKISGSDGIMSHELGDRVWRAVKVACVIACIESATSEKEDIVIEKAHWDSALYICGYIADQINAYVGSQKKNETPYDLYLEIVNHPRISTTELKETLKKDISRNKRRFDELIEDVSMYCSENNERLVVESGKGLARYYLIEDDITTSEVSVNVFNSDDMENITLSFSNDIVKDYKARKVPLNKLSEIVKMGFNYSSFQFTDEYRASKNTLPSVDTVIFDIDNDGEGELLFEEACALLHDVKAFLITSKSHLSEEKGGKNRYRIILPVWNLNTSDKNAYKSIMMNIAKYLGVEKYVDDKCIGDIARFYYPSPADAISYHCNGKVLDATVFVPEESDTISYDKGVVKYSIEYTPRNAVGEDFIVTTKQGDVMLSSLSFAGSGDSIPCKCPNPLHEDAHPSAYVIQLDNGNKMIKCSGCDYRMFDK